MTKKRTRKLTPIPELEIRIRAATMGGYDIVLFGVPKHPKQHEFTKVAGVSDLKWHCIRSENHFNEVCNDVRAGKAHVYAMKPWVRDWHSVKLITRFPLDGETIRTRHSPPDHAPRKRRHGCPA